MEKRRARIVVIGVVQGVGYRYFAHRRGNALGVYGFARNLPDGSVEAMVEGDESLVIEMIEELKRGPHSAEVYSIQVDWEEYTGEFHNFNIRF
jgi:acylphosphatase